ncbi:MAG: NUDIX domain-containing protein [Acidimicrobiia bacterium]
MTETVVAGLLLRHGRILLCHRAPERKNFPNVWDLPGGHVEDGETATDALTRELAEELGIGVDATSPRLWRTLRAEGVELHIYLVDQWWGEPCNIAPDEHDDIRWVDESALDHLELAHRALVVPLKDALADHNG